jgi:hypothetical protein
MLMWIAIVSAVLIVIAAILTFVALGEGGGNGGGSTPAALEEAGCTVTEHPGQPAQHVTALEEGFEYNSDPPSSGPHSNTAAVFDVYEDPVDPLLTVHSMEHGAVIIQYGDDVPETEIESIVTWYRDDPNGIIVAPLPRMNDQIALTAWNAEGPQDSGEGIVAKCSGFDEEAFDAFVETYGFKGPESDRGDGVGFAREDLRPGA